MSATDRAPVSGELLQGQNHVYTSPLEAVLVFLVPGFLQGLAWWALIEFGIDQKPSSFLIAVLMAVTVTPVAHFLTTTRATRIPAAIYALCLGLFIAALYLLAEASFGVREDDVDEHLVMICFSASFLIAYISAPFFRTVIERGEKPTHYPGLFEFAWNLPVVGIASFFFSLALWAVLGMWALLFKLIGIDFFADLFSEPWFACSASAAGGAVAIGIVREREGIVLALRSVLFALLRVLSPVLALATALFAIAALQQGLDMLWDDWSATSTMVGAITIAVVLSNAVVGEAGMPGSPILRWSVRLQALVLPVLAGFAVYGLWVRLHEYGLTVSRIYAAIVVLFAAAYSVAYFIGGVLPRGWAFLRQANIALAGLVFIVAILVQTPLINSWSWTVNDQIARLKDGRISPAEFDYAYFQFELGRAGQEGLDRLLADDSLPEHDFIADQVEAVRLAKHKYQFGQDEGVTLSRLERAIEDGAIALAPAGAELPPSLMQKLSVEKWMVGDCIEKTDMRCILLRTEVLGGDEPQFLLFRDDTGARYGREGARINTNLLLRLNGEWVDWGIDPVLLDSREAADAFMDAVAAGEATPGTITLRTLDVGGEQVLFQHLDETLRERLVVTGNAAPVEAEED